MYLKQVIQEAVQSISTMESRRQAFGEKLRAFKKQELSPDNRTVFEKELSAPLKKSPFSGNVGGVDSGFVGKSLYLLDLVLVRSVGVVFEYSHGKVARAHYCPSFFSFPTPHLQSHALELDELNCSKGLVRLKEEITTATKLIEQYSLDYCLLDGSIIPQYADKPRTDSKIKNQYHSLIECFEKLFETAERRNCSLVGCVEDSRGSRFRTILQETILKNSPLGAAAFLNDTFDAVLLDYFLEVGERSMVFSYSSDIGAHPILSDFSDKWKNRVFACYLKPAILDRPLRIEFLHTPEKKLSEEANEHASMIFFLSSLHREYAYPSVLIEADLHCRLKPDEADIVYNKIMDKLGKKFRMRLRRDSRPF